MGGGGKIMARRRWSQMIAGFINAHLKHRFKKVHITFAQFGTDVCIEGQITFESYKDLNENILFCANLDDGEFYICFTCDGKLKKKVIPCQAVANKLAAERLLGQFQTIQT